jgi:hypothetical protein
MGKFKESVEAHIKASIFSKTAEQFLYCNGQDDEIYATLKLLGETLCAEYIPGQSSFYLVDGARVQAVAIHPYQTVLVCKGMLEFVFRLSSMMVGAERRQNFPDEQFYEPWCNRVWSWLNGGNLDWEDSRHWWLHDSAFRTVFNYCSKTIFTFIVLHEIGHLHHMHGARRLDKALQSGSFSVDEEVIHEAVAIHSAKTKADKISAHACEIAADTYAFQFLIDEVKSSIFDIEDYTSSGDQKTCVSSYCMAIYSVASFFWGLSFIYKMQEDAQDNDYPSHAFRLHSIETACLEHRICGMAQPHAVFALEFGMKSYTKKIICAARNEDFVHWRLKINHKQNQDHYYRICEAMSSWSNMAFGTRDEDWAKNTTRASSPRFFVPDEATRTKPS